MAFPLPPPLPTQKGFTPTKSKIKSCFSASITMNHSLDCLFDEGYRADVSILMDYDNVIYAHASILVSCSSFFSLKIVLVHRPVVIFVTNRMTKYELKLHMMRGRDCCLLF